MSANTAAGEPKKRKRTSQATGQRAGARSGFAEAAEAVAACRAMYESEPGATCVSVAEKTGIPEGTVRRWKSEAITPWVHCQRRVGDLVGRAGALANSFTLKMSELGHAMTDKIAADAVGQEVAVQHAVNLRAQIINRHRTEWSVPRRLAYEAVKGSDWEKAKMAKIVAETLGMVQAGESRAWGITAEAKGADGGAVVVIERDGEVSEVPADGAHTPTQRAADSLLGQDGGPGSEDDF